VTKKVATKEVVSRLGRCGGFASPQKPNRFYQSQCALGIFIGGVLRNLKAHGHFTLVAQVINLIRPHLFDNPPHIQSVIQRPIVHYQILA